MLSLQKIKKKFILLQEESEKIFRLIKNVSEEEALELQKKVDNLVKILPVISLEINAWEKLDSPQYAESSEYFNLMLSHKHGNEQTKMSAYMGLGIYHSFTKGYGSKEVKKAYTQLALISKNLQLVVEYFSSLRGLWSHNVMNFELGKALEISQEMLEIASKVKHPTLLIESYVANTVINFFNASWDEMHFAHKKILLLCQKNGESEDFFLEHPILLTMAMSSLSDAYQNNPDKAVKKIMFAHSVLENVKNISDNKKYYNKILVLFYIARIHQIRGDIRSTIKFAEKMQNLAKENNIFLWQNIAEIILGWALIKDKQKSLTLIENAFIKLEDFEIKLYKPLFFSFLAESYQKVGHYDKAYGAIQKAHSLLDQRNNIHAPEILIIKGQILLDQNKQSEAINCFQNSHKVAKENRMKFMTLGSLLKLAKCTQGDQSVYYRNEIKNIYGSFQEGFETSSLIEAKTLISS